MANMAGFPDRESLFLPRSHFTPLVGAGVGALYWVGLIFFI